MTDRPILFSAPMVRALLDGTKTQTRRICNPQLLSLTGSGKRIYRDEDFRASWADSPGATHSSGFKDCRYGSPGDRLWVRETCRAMDHRHVVYLADNGCRMIGPTRADADAWCKLNRYRGLVGATVPPIHMPRWASRITLELTGVRVERLQDISEEDAKAEGAEAYQGPVATDRPYRLGFARLWSSIHGDSGPNAWGSDPYVWVLTFKRVTP